MWWLFVTGALAGSLADLDAMAAYGGLGWGSAPTDRMLTADARPDLRGIRSFVRPEEPNQAGAFALSRRWYDYCFERLCQVRLEVAPTVQMTSLIDALTERYGAPTERTEPLIRVWRGDKVALTCDFRGVSGLLDVARLAAELRALGEVQAADDLERAARRVHAATCTYAYRPLVEPKLPIPGL